MKSTIGRPNNDGALGARRCGPAANVLHDSPRAIAAAIPRAFTLLELVLVMTILAIAAAMVAPSLRGFGRGRQAGNCAQQIIALAHWAHTQAIARSLPYRLNLDPTAGTYWITVEQDDGRIQAPGEEAGRVFTAPDGVTLSWTVPPHTDGQYIRFLPTGRIDLAATQPPGALQSLSSSPAPATIRVTGAEGRVIEIACNSATELFHEVTQQERQAQ